MFILRLSERDCFMGFMIRVQKRPRFVMHELQCSACPLLITVT